jgi:hypothetical protein
VDSCLRRMRGGFPVISRAYLTGGRQISHKLTSIISMR